MNHRTLPVAAEPRKGILGYLSLFLLLLVFFIVLNAVSVRQAGRAAAVIGSVGEAFGAGTPAADASATAAMTAAVAEALRAVSALGDLPPADLAVTKVDDPRPGAAMVVALPAAALFEPGRSTVLAARAGLFDRIADALRPRSSGPHYRLEELIGVGAPPEAPAHRAEVRARAAALGAVLLARGVPPDSLSVGVEQGRPAEVRFIFAADASEPAQSGDAPHAP
jgi:hypothetical protein